MTIPYCEQTQYRTGAVRQSYVRSKPDEDSLECQYASLRRYKEINCPGLKLCYNQGFVLEKVYEKSLYAPLPLLTHTHILLSQIFSTVYLSNTFNLMHMEEEGRNVDLTISFFASSEEGVGESRSKIQARLQ